MKRVQYYFDFLSPYSYFSFLNLKKRGFFDLYDIELKPVVMGSLFNHFEMKGPGMIRPKRHYMLKQCFIYSARNQVPFTPPDQHPFNPLYSLRLATKACAKDKQLEIVELLFNSCWAKGLSLGDPDDLKPILDNAGFDAEVLLSDTFNSIVKKELKQNIKDATSNGIFGVPSFLVDGEMFWGNDSIEQLDLYLKDNFPTWNSQLYKEKLLNDNFEG